MIAILAAIYLGAWGIPPSSFPHSAQSVTDQTQPAQHDAAANPSVEKQKSESDQRAGKKENHEGREQSFVERAGKFVREYNAEIVTISTAIMAIFTVGLFISTYLLWKSGEKHSERELRSYVNFVSMTMSHFGAGKLAEGFLVIRNCGQTPAYKLKDRSSIRVEGFPSTEVHLPTWEEFSSCMGPGGELTLQPRMDQPMTGQEEADIRTGKKAIYISAEIRYLDAFGTERCTKHRAFHHGQLPGADIGVFQFQHTPEHHDSD
jgi:hypothetical protein